MNLKEIKELIEFAVRQDLDELEVEQSGFKIRIRKRTTAVAASPAVATPAAVAAGAAPAVDGSAPAPRPQPVAVEIPADLHTIKSPIVGTFYRSASPDAEPFVKIGDFVEKGTVLCIIEAMKLLNEIESEVSGEIVEIYVENGTPVEYGEPLFAVRLRS